MNSYLLTLISVIGLSLAGCKDEAKKETITVAVSPDYPPFTFIKESEEAIKDDKFGIQDDKSSSQEISGFEIDLFDEISKRLNMPIKYKSIPFQDIFDAIEKKEVTASIANITVTDDRKKRMDFSIPYISTGYALVVKDKEIDGLSDIENESLGIQSNTSYENLFRDKMESVYPKIKIDGAARLSDLVQKLKDDYVKAIFAGKSEAQAIANENKDFYVVSLNMKESNDFAIVLPKNSGLTKDINSALGAMLEDGFVKKLKEKWKIK